MVAHSKQIENQAQSALMLKHRGRGKPCLYAIAQQYGRDLTASIGKIRSLSLIPSED